MADWSQVLREQRHQAANNAFSQDKFQSVNNYIKNAIKIDSLGVPLLVLSLFSKQNNKCN